MTYSLSPGFRNSQSFLPLTANGSDTLLLFLQAALLFRLQGRQQGLDCLSFPAILFGLSVLLLPCCVSRLAKRIHLAILKQRQMDPFPKQKRVYSGFALHDTLCNWYMHEIDIKGLPDDSNYALSCNAVSVIDRGVREGDTVRFSFDDAVVQRMSRAGLPQWLRKDVIPGLVLVDVDMIDNISIRGRRIVSDGNNEWQVLPKDCRYAAIIRGLRKPLLPDPGQNNEYYTQESIFVG
jgi:hypothetical protein